MSNEESKNNKVNQLIAILGKKFDLTGKEIADIFWLTLKRQEHSNHNIGDTSSSQKAEQLKPPPIEQNPISENTHTDSESSTVVPEKPKNNSEKEASEVQTSSESSSDTTPTADVIPKTPTTSSTSETIPLRIPDAPSLREPLKLARSLKPLMRWINSGREIVLDETKSVERTAAEEFCIPVLKPELEHLLELALVVDESKSMLIWRHTVIELKRLLENSGFFRDVRIWGMITDENGEIALRPGIGKTANKQRCANHKELTDPNGRRLILVVSDCVAGIWHNGALNSIFQDWTNSQPVAIIQMLPDWLWLKTGLSNGASVRFGSLAPMVANKKLLIKEELLWKDINLDTGIKVPVLTLESEVAANWSQMVVGKSDAEISGFVFPREFKDNPQLDSQNKSQSTKSQLNPQERVYRFRMTASPMARKLASLLAAAPVINLPVVRLIRETMLPKSQQVHVAEVFLGGLLKPLTEIAIDTNPDMVQYDFMHDEIRNILLKAAPESDSVDVLDTVSKYIAGKIGKSVQEFVALLKAPGGIEEEQVKPFAEVAIKILKQLGGDYAAFAEQLEPTSQTVTETQDAPEKFKDFPPLQTFEFEDITISIEDDETTINQKSTNKTSAINLQRFTFEVATVEQKKLGQNTELIIHRQQKQNQYFIQDLGNGIELEMVMIKGGTFTMGAPENEKGSSESERPQHQVTVPTFFMSKYQVTQAQWRAVATLPKINYDLKLEPSRFDGDNLPVEQVSWYDAVEFCARLSNHTGIEYRLPSEAEWEYACRAGTATPFHFGETISGELANYRASVTYAWEPKAEYRLKTTTVGQFPSNAFGLYDMHGNIWEWCFDDWHENYQGAPTNGSAWLKPASNDIRVIRGGSWYSSPQYCRSAYRDWYDSRGAGNHLGLRVVCVVPS